MKVYVICEEVDLGYHIVEVHASQSRAETRCDELRAAAFLAKVGALEAIGYTKSKAQEHAHWVVDKYSVEAHNVVR